MYKCHSRFDQLIGLVLCEQLLDCFDSLVDRYQIILFNNVIDRFCQYYVICI